MKVLRVLIIVFILFYCHRIEAVNHFTIENSDSQLTRTSIESTFTKTTEVRPFILETPISALCITGKIIKESDEYLVRVLLKDKLGHYYCVLESYDIINDEANFSFADYCEETSILANVIPTSLKIVIKGAVLKINEIGVLNEAKNLPIERLTTKQQKNKEAQVDNIIQRINSYNEEHNKLWRAGITPLGLKSYEEKQRLLGLNDDETSEGIEYYVDGIFESGTPASLTPTNRLSSYVEEFDWRNRHGQNWMTSVKHQGNSSFCYSFCAIGAIEAMANIYYNRLLNLNLSEDEGARCPYSYDTYNNGGLAATVLEYAKYYGICDEVAYPFIDSCCIPCKRDIIVPNEIVKIEDYTYVGNSSEEAIKGALINNGPMTSGYIGHAMVMVGYATIKEGDVISIHTGTGIYCNITINSGDPRIGKTYWIFKNSYGTNAYGCNNGYWYILFNNLSNMREPYYLTRPYCTIDNSNNVVNCSDNDGDGYYFWGIGPKPSNCPSWVPDTPDGDDSDINYGSIDSYGFLDELPEGITIKTPVTYASNSSTSYRYGIVNGGTLTITGTTTLIGDSKIRVCEGGILIVDGGTLQDADITMVPGSTLIVRNNGVVNMATGKAFVAPKGVVVDIESGTIN